MNRVLRFERRTAAPAPSALRDGVAAAPQQQRWSATLARNLVACAKDLETLRAAQRAVIDALQEGLRASAAATATADDRVWVELPALSPAPTSLDGIVALARALAGTRARSTSAA